jgi:hypothetical protein
VPTAGSRLTARSPQDAKRYAGHDPRQDGDIAASIRVCSLFEPRTPIRAMRHNGDAGVVLGAHDVPGVRQPSIQEPVRADVFYERCRW